jgi:hypothetical protein
MWALALLRKQRPTILAGLFRLGRIHVLQHLTPYDHPLREALATLLEVAL